MKIGIFITVLILSRAWGTRDENNGGLDLLTLRLQSLLITLNYNTIAILHTF
jgi:hypothetical protein